VLLHHSLRCLPLPWQMQNYGLREEAQGIRACRTKQPAALP
jgi:hypothetical protein